MHLADGIKKPLPATGVVLKCAPVTRKVRLAGAEMRLKDKNWRLSSIEFEELGAAENERLAAYISHLLMAPASKQGKIQLGHIIAPEEKPK